MAKVIEVVKQIIIDDNGNEYTVGEYDREGKLDTRSIVENILIDLYGGKPIAAMKTLRLFLEIAEIPSPIPSVAGSHAKIGGLKISKDVIQDFRRHFGGVKPSFEELNAAEHGKVDPDDVNLFMIRQWRDNLRYQINMAMAAEHLAEIFENHFKELERESSRD